jgi:hypothetical protein
MGGWGLHFVAQLSDDWGTVSDEDSTAVWLVRHASSN